MDISRPEEFRVHVAQFGDELLLERRADRSTATGELGFLMLMMASSAVTAGCWYLMLNGKGERTVLSFLIPLQFLAFGVAPAWDAFRLFFGTEGLRIGPDGLDYRSRALISLQERHIPLGEIQGIVLAAEEAHGGEGGIKHGLKIATSGKPVRFGRSIGPRECQWLADLLQRHLQALRPDRVVTLQTDGRAVAKPTEPIEVLRPTGATLKPPWDCAIRVYSAWDCVEFVRRWAFSLVSDGYSFSYRILKYGVTSSSLILNLTLGGCLLFMPFILKDAHPWFLFLVLSPFEVIGLYMYLAVSATQARPFWVERWTVRPREITARSSLGFGLGRPRRIEAKGVGRIELRKHARSRKMGLIQMSFQEQEGDAPFALGLVGREGQDLLVIDSLTEGEARWMGGQMCELLKGSLLNAGEAMAPLSRTSDPLWDREFDQ